MPVFNRKRKLDTSQVDDRRGQRALGGMPLPITAGGGTIGMIIMVVLFLVLGGPGALDSSGGTGALNESGDNSALEEECQTGADAAEREDCRAVA